MMTTRAALGALLCVALPVSAPAVSIQVPTGDSIGAALAVAQPGDSVLVQEGTYVENVVLVEGVQLLGGFDATFSGSARDPVLHRTIIDGAGIGSAIAADSLSSATVVDGFVITGGGGMPGSGIRVAGGAPVFSNNEITGNRRAGIGGGAFVFGGSSARFENNRFLNNSSGGSGGGIHIQNSSPVIVGNLFDGNWALGGGGGTLYLFNSAAACSSNVIRNSRAGESGGGAVRLQNNPPGAVFVGNDFEDCQAPLGGAVFLKDDSSVYLEDNDFVNCHALPYGASLQELGGGVALSPFCDATLINCRFANCSAAGAGGAVYATESSLVVRGSDATDPGSVDTGSITDCTSGANGGAVFADNSTGEVSRIRIENCTATGLGGALYIDTSPFVVQENVIANCSANDGGAIAVFSTLLGAPTSFILNNTIYGCSASTTNSGGGILHSGLNDQSLAVIAGNLITNTTSGACIRCRKSAGGGGASRPTINCSTCENAPGNPSDVIANPKCQSAFGVDGSNRIGDPLFCDTVGFQLQACSPDVNSLESQLCFSAVPGREDRGADFESDAANSYCSCAPFALEPLSWGRIKARYR